ncbi:MAG: 30S ribosomal protein S12 methylthiotransferase RimO, partial [Acidobacteria bacterium]|nr:30S ribosomal protein S12 methylthiotransferase RimO [Acidobacteriota bacterium]
MKIGFLSLGCPKNLVDSEVMLGLVRDAGHEITADAREADTLVVNTCAFIDSAKQESINAILEMAELKKTGRCRKLVVTGCLAERYRDTLRAEIPEIDVVLGTGEVPAIVGAVSQNSEMSGRKIFRLTASAEGYGESRRSALRARRRKPEATSPAEATKTPAEATEGLPTYIYDADTPRLLATPPHYAYLKVAEGCDYACAFCIIATLRGPYRSRPADGIVCEVEQLAERGVREVILV